MAMQCCVCSEILVEMEEVEKLQATVKENEASKVSSGYCPDCFGRLVGSAIGVKSEKMAA
ncbi:MAG: hypothetical protein HOC91_01505 [Nitrospinaceae bacterium]|jgi:hypothetical protein|nr:hypothetical protein [Nitrospinaceae bacterium]MBT3435229.1 hypothetical protein [Nitrospinaceae bacterium]MBT3821526.1 hypothetical protein [Nitrospinaceae bacterium]MBT4094815.1 hypothetical protein [Nitrospinaceae bacterium]MBT4429170.1 hypothetical protein [Nitrospinaceae bacterium]